MPARKYRDHTMKSQQFQQFAPAMAGTFCAFRHAHTDRLRRAWRWAPDPRPPARVAIAHPAQAQPRDFGARVTQASVFHGESSGLGASMGPVRNSESRRLISGRFETASASDRVNRRPPYADLSAASWASRNARRKPTQPPQKRPAIVTKRNNRFNEKVGRPSITPL